MTKVNQNQAQLGSRLLNIYQGEREDQGRDIYEKIGQGCVFYLHVAGGKQITLRKEKACETKTAHLALRILCGIAFVVTLPLSLIGMALIKASKTHQKAHEAALASLKIEEINSKSEKPGELNSDSKPLSSKAVKPGELNSKPPSSKEDSKPQSAKQETKKRETASMQNPMTPHASTAKQEQKAGGNPSLEEMRKRRLEYLSKSSPTKVKAASTPANLKLPSTTQSSPSPSIQKPLNQQTEEKVLTQELKAILNDFSNLIFDAITSMENLEKEANDKLTKENDKVPQQEKTLQQKLEIAKEFEDKAKAAETQFLQKKQTLYNQSFKQINNFWTTNKETIAYNSLYIKESNELINLMKDVFDKKRSLEAAIDAKKNRELLELELKKATSVVTPVSVEIPAAKEFEKVKKFIEENPKNLDVPLLLNYLRTMQSMTLEERPRILNSLKYIINECKIREISIFQNNKFDADNALGLAIKFDSTPELEIVKNLIDYIKETEKRKKSKQPSMLLFSSQYIALNKDKKVKLTKLFAIKD